MDQRTLPVKQKNLYEEGLILHYQLKRSLFQKVTAWNAFLHLGEGLMSRPLNLSHAKLEYFCGSEP